MPILAHMPDVVNVDKKQVPEYVIDHILHVMDENFPGTRFTHICMFILGKNSPDDVRQFAYEWNARLQTSLDEACLELKKDPMSEENKARAQAALNDLTDLPTKYSEYLVMGSSGLLRTRLPETTYRDILASPEEYVYVHTIKV